ncbi:MAG: pilin [Candidatus Paceibacterota bacterium]
MINRLLTSYKVIFLVVLVFVFVFSGGFNHVSALDPGNLVGSLPTDEGTDIPRNCVDVDGSGSIDERDCGDPNNSSCAACGATVDSSPSPRGSSPSPSGNNGTSGLPGEDFTIQDVFAIINGLACWLIRVATLVMIIFIILAGFKFMTAQGDPAKLTGAKKNFKHVLIGMVVIMGAYVIIATVANAVGADFSFVPLVC